MTLKVVRNEAPVGAEIVGVDLATPVDDATLAALRAALDEHGLIYLRGQMITPAQYVAFGRRLGTLERHVFDQFLLKDHPEIVVLSNVVENGKAIGVADAGQYWHTDGAFTPHPHIYSVLHSQEIPVDERGKALGSTMFVSTIHAFDTLPPVRQQQLRPLRGLHSLIAQYEKKKSSGIGRHVPLTPEQKQRTPDLYHPIVWPHPRTGRECLYVNEGTTFGIEGMPHAEAIALIHELCAHVSRPAAVYHHPWKVGDVLIWDNYSTQHKVNFNFGPDRRRRMHRMTVS